MTMRGLGGFAPQELEAIQRRQAGLDRNVKPRPALKSRASLSCEDWRRIGAALTQALNSVTTATARVKRSQSRTALPVQDLARAVLGALRAGNGRSAR
jgi:hypothetical protein